MLANNLIYDDTYAGLFLFESTNATIANNTIYEPTAGVTAYAPNPTTTWARWCSTILQLA